MRKCFIDESGDGVLFGPKGRNRLLDADAPLYFMLGMVYIEDIHTAENKLTELRQSLIHDPNYNKLRSMQPEREQTYKYFHATNDHPDIRNRVFKILPDLKFQFFAVVINLMEFSLSLPLIQKNVPEFRYHPNFIYDRAMRVLSSTIKNKFQFPNVVDLGSWRKMVVTIADRNFSKRSEILKNLINGIDYETSIPITTDRLQQSNFVNHAQIEIDSSCNQIGLQIVDYCLWALQRHYQKYESHYLQSIWHRVENITMSNIFEENPLVQYGGGFLHTTPLPNLDEIQYCAQHYLATHRKK